MPKLKLQIIQALAGNYGIETVPHLANSLDLEVDMSILEALYQLRKDGLINWRPGKYMYLSKKGYEVLNAATV